MQAQTITDLLRKGDRVAVSNITGREANNVTTISQRYANNIVGGWALGKGGREIVIEKDISIPVFSDYGELLEKLPQEKWPNKIIIYSPPDAVYGDLKNVVNTSVNTVETIFIITENVSVEVSSKIRNLCLEKNIDVLGCNTLGIINVTDHIRVGAVGGDQPEETFHPGSATIISNSGNMVNTMATYLYGAGIGVRYGISTGKDQLILTPLKDIMELVLNDEKTKVVILYIEPGGLYEQIALQWMNEVNFSKPIIAYIGGTIADETNLSLGHAGAVAEGKGTRAKEKIELFDRYLDFPPYIRGKSLYRTRKPERGLRIQALHDLPDAARTLYNNLQIDRDYKHYRPLKLNPWLKNMGKLAKKLPPKLVLSDGVIPSPYKKRFCNILKTHFGKVTTLRNMRNASHASSNDGQNPRIYRENVIDLMATHSFEYSLILSWTGYPPSRNFETELVKQSLVAAFTNGPGTISAQGAKLSASAGNDPHTAMIATLATIGSVHGGNGSKAVEFLMNIFSNSKLVNPYSPESKKIIMKAAKDYVKKMSKIKKMSKETDIPFEKVPCLGHPVYRNKLVNIDPREQVLTQYLESSNVYHAFFDFYHELATNMQKEGVTKNVLAVNIDAAIACVWLGICWPLICDKKITVARAKNIPFLAFALGRAAGGAAEYLDHADYGSSMDMRVPVSECEILNLPK